jgi:hypothetical protein
MVVEPWRKLKVGDRIRIVRTPSEFERSGVPIEDYTLALYRDLIARGRPLRICEINEYGSPCVWCRFRNADGSWPHHHLAVNDDSKEEMTSDRKKPGVAFWATLVVVAVFVIYPLSLGPACWLLTQEWKPEGTHGVVQQVFAPILWVYRNGPQPVHNVMRSGEIKVSGTFIASGFFRITGR